MFRAWRLMLLSAALFLSFTTTVNSFFAPVSRSIGAPFIFRNCGSVNKQLDAKEAKCSRRYDSKITVFDFEEEDVKDESDTRTDEEKGLTHGYEGKFKVGDVVKVKSDIRIWSVKQHSKDGFICKYYEGTVVSMAMYGRKEKALCSAITPLRVQFEVDGNGIPAGFFERKWIAHFAGDELELISNAKPVEPAAVP